MQKLIFYFLLIIPFNVMCKTLNSEDYCHAYVSMSVNLFEENQVMGCNFSNSRWNDEGKKQFNWCRSVTKNITEKENNIRNLMLNRCIREKIFSKENFAHIASECRDKKGKYFPIKKIKKRNGLEAVISSNGSGFINHDFNLDGKNDNFFIERDKKNQTRFIQCLSNKWGEYKRKIVQLDIAEENFPYSIGSGGLSIYLLDTSPAALVVSKSYIEHNFTGNSESWIFQYNKELQALVLVTYERNEGMHHTDDQGSDVDLKIDFLTKKYQYKSYNSLCSSCPSQEKNGQVIAPANVLGGFEIGTTLLGYKNTNPQRGAVFTLKPKIND